MARVCKASDVEIARYPMLIKSMLPRQTLSVAAIRQAIERHNERIATVALTTIRNALPEAGSLRAHLIAAVSDLIGERYDAASIGVRLRKTGGKVLDRKIIDCAADLGLSRPKAAREVILNMGLEKSVPDAPRGKPVIAAKLPPKVAGSFIATPTKAQLMGRRS
jgi:hypothetical protein